MSIEFWASSEADVPSLSVCGEFEASGLARSSRWAGVRARFLTSKRCACCRRQSNLNAHHVKPFHLFPELELDENNLIPLCEGGPWNCHFLCGHAGRTWKHYSPDPMAVVDRFREFLIAVGLIAQGG